MTDDTPYSRGYADGKADGRTIGFEAGWQAALDAFLSAVPIVVNTLAKSGNADNPVLPLDSHVNDLNLSVRTRNFLIRSGLSTVRDVVNKSERELRRIPYLGPKGVEELIAELSRYGYKLAPPKGLWT